MSEMDLEELSFRNLVNYYHEELLYVHRNKTYPDTLTEHQRHRLNKLGVTSWRGGFRGCEAYLTPRTKNIIIGDSEPK